VDFGATEHHPAVGPSTNASTPEPGSLAHGARGAIRPGTLRLELR
jgi:hypothetical protein